MLIIRNEQLPVLGFSQRQAFIDKSLADLKELFPGDARVQNESATRALIEDAVARAGKFGIESAREVSLFIFLVQELGAGFESEAGHEWMQPLLRDHTIPASARLDLLYARLEAAQEEERA